MRIEEGQFVGSVSRRMYVTALLAAVGLALFLSAVWTARNENALVSDYGLYAARFAKVTTCFVIAFLYRGHIPSLQRMLVAGSGFIALHLGVYTATFFLASSSDEYVMASVLSGVFSGIGEAFIILMFAHLLSTFAPRISAVAIPLAYLINEVLYYSTLYLPSSVIVVVRPAGKVLAIALLIWCAYRKRSVAPGGEERPFQYGVALRSGREPLLSFLSSSQEWMLMLAGATLFPFLFGFVAQISSSAGTNSGLYDVMNELTAIGVLVLLVAVGFLRGRRLTFEEALYFAVPLFATGCLLLPFCWNGGVPWAELLVKCGNTIYRVFIWILLARKCYEDIRHTYLYFGVFYGLIEMATVVARLLVSWLWQVDLVDFATMAAAALFSLWLVALYGLLFFAITNAWGRKRAQGDSGLARPDASAVGDGFLDAKDEAPGRGESPGGPVEETESLFARRLDAFCFRYEITPRERQVLIEAMHGYSMENIGRKLCVSRETVKTHLRRVYAKVGVSGKQELISAIDHFDEI